MIVLNYISFKAKSKCQKNIRDNKITVNHRKQKTRKSVLMLQELLNSGYF